MKDLDLDVMIHYFLIPFTQKKMDCVLTDDQIGVMKRAYPDIISRSKNLMDCADLLKIYLVPDAFDISIIDYSIFIKLKDTIDSIDFQSSASIKNDLVKFANDCKYAIRDVMNLLRVIMTGKDACPPIHNVLYALGKMNTVLRFTAINI